MYAPGLAPCGASMMELQSEFLVQNVLAPFPPGSWCGVDLRSIRFAKCKLTETLCLVKFY